MLTLINTYRVILDVGLDDWSFEDRIPIMQDALELPEIVIEDYGTTDDYQRALRPAFDALWNAGGYPRCNYFNVDGVWTGHT